MKQISNLFYDMDEYEITINIYKLIKEQEKTDGDCYLKIAKIYDEKLDQKKEALQILKEGLDKVLDDSARQEIELLIQKIEKEELDLILGINDNKENECDNIINDKVEPELNLKFNSSEIKDDKVNNEVNNNNEIKDENIEQKDEVIKI